MSAAEILKARYARSEIDGATFRDMIVDGRQDGHGREEQLSAMWLSRYATVTLNVIAMR